MQAVLVAVAVTAQVVALGARVGHDLGEGLDDGRLGEELAVAVWAAATREMDITCRSMIFMQTSVLADQSPYLSRLRWMRVQVLSSSGPTTELVFVSLSNS